MNTHAGTPGLPLPLDHASTGLSDAGVSDASSRSLRPVPGPVLEEALAGAPDSGSLRLDDQLCFALYAAGNRITRAYRPLLAQLGLTYPQYLVMLVLWEADDIATRHVAERLDLPRNALSPLLNRLETAGLVTRHVSAHDRREIRVRLTPTGRGLQTEAVEAARTVARGLSLTPEQVRALRSDLQRLR